MSNNKIGFTEAVTFGGATEIKIHRLKCEDPVADLAIRIASQLAICAAKEDGEDKAGRQALRLMEPKEVAARACDIAAAMWDNFEERGWILDLPPPKEASVERLMEWESKQAERTQTRLEKLRAQSTESGGGAQVAPKSE